MTGRHFEFEKAFKGVRLGHLTHFVMKDSSKEFSKIGIAEFVKACPNLMHIDFTGCEQMNDETIKHIVCSLRKLQEIILLQNNIITDKFFDNVQHMPMSLRRLELGGKPRDFQKKITP